MGLFGKSFEEKVNDALEQVRAKNPGVRGLSASIEDRTVTLSGEVDSMEAKTAIAEAFNALVETENTLNMVRVSRPTTSAAATRAEVAAEAAPEPAPVTRSAGHEGPIESPPGVGGAHRVHEVERGDTLSALAQKYYGKASEYRKIFEANRDQLDNPDLIKVGQKLRIPE